MLRLKDWEKLGVSEVLKIVKYGSGFYLRIPKDLVDALNLKPKDRLHVRLVAVRRYEEVAV